MKNLLIFVVFAILASFALATPFSKLSDSDFAVGEKGPDDIIEYRYTNVTNRPGNLGITWYFGTYSNITYVSAVESGEYPDARASITEGGPGYDHVTIELRVGPLGNFNYIIEIWGEGNPIENKNGGVFAKMQSLDL